MSMACALVGVYFGGAGSWLIDGAQHGGCEYDSAVYLRLIQTVLSGLFCAR